MLILGLTGSIGMGKSTTAAMFAARGIPVHDADAAVHRLYRGAAAGPIGHAFPNAVVGSEVNRARLAREVIGRPEALERLEGIIHPLVRGSEAEFLAACRSRNSRLVVLDIPLLFEVKGEYRVDAILVVTADAETQRRRVMARPGMTDQKFESLLARQLPDAEKRRQAHLLVNSGHGIAAAQRQVDAVLRALSPAG